MKLHSADDAAQRLGISARLVRRYCTEGRLGTKIAGSWVITDAELDQFIKEPRPVGRPPKR